jgi:hypothetical protein
MTPALLRAMRRPSATVGSPPSSRIMAAPTRAVLKKKIEW